MIGRKFTVKRFSFNIMKEITIPLKCISTGEENVSMRWNEVVVIIKNFLK
jgi:hypothetical protein